jgi:hypothetical protein
MLPDGSLTAASGTAIVTYEAYRTDVTDASN